jgi:IS1 family transposase
MNKLSIEKRTAILSALVEGCSIASTCRITGAAKMTVLSLLKSVGEACDDLQDRWFRGLECKRIQCDEIWSFVGMKAKNVPEHLRTTFGFGDVWTFVAIDADTKLVPCWRLGRRDDLATDEFIFDLASRLKGRVQITTDGLATYPPAIQCAFDRGSSVDYGVVVKNYNEAPKEERRRYSPSKFVSAELKAVFGEPDPDFISTSYIERQNLNIRMGNRRMTRLTNAFSKKVVNHARQLAINFAHHNFVRIHQSLRCTPAMAAGITSEVWSIADLIHVTDEYEMTRSWPLANVA